MQLVDCIGSYRQRHMPGITTAGGPLLRPYILRVLIIERARLLLLAAQHLGHRGRAREGNPANAERLPERRDHQRRRKACERTGVGMDVIILGTCLDTKPVARLSRSAAQSSAGLAVHTRYSRPWRPTVASTRDRTPAGALTDAPNDERPDNDRLLVHERLEPAEEAHGRERPVGPWSWFG